MLRLCSSRRTASNGSSPSCNPFSQGSAVHSMTGKNYLASSASSPQGCLVRKAYFPSSNCCSHACPAPKRPGCASPRPCISSCAATLHSCKTSTAVPLVWLKSCPITTESLGPRMRPNKAWAVFSSLPRKRLVFGESHSLPVSKTAWFPSKTLPAPSPTAT